MSINWKDIWNRYFFFGANNKEDEIPPSITSNLETPENAEYDINFQRQVRDMIGDDTGVSGVFGSADYMSWIAGAEQSKETKVRLYA